MRINDIYTMQADELDHLIVARLHQSPSLSAGKNRLGFIWFECQYDDVLATALLHRLDLAKLAFMSSDDIWSWLKGVDGRRFDDGLCIKVSTDDGISELGNRQRRQRYFRIIDEGAKTDDWDRLRGDDMLEHLSGRTPRRRR